MQNVPRKGNTSVRLKRCGLKGIALIIFLSATNASYTNSPHQ